MIEPQKKRILFVDDEPNILKGLRRLFRNMRHEWDMVFVDSGAKALEKMGQSTFDVIVSDMRMPEMNGLQLLSKVEQLYPMVVRIVLSGYSDQELMLQSTRAVHQYLSKPCEPETLINAVARSCALREILTKDVLKATISRIHALPSLPALYNEIMTELRSSNGSINQVGKIIEKDLSMSAKVLQLVNSSFFGLSRRVSNPSHAVVLLGLETIRSLVLTIGLFSKFDEKALAGLDIQSIFDHSLRVGAIARAIAEHEKLDQALTDTTFLAGLLHDFGKLVFAANFPTAYREVLQQFRETNAPPLVDLETKIVGASHAEAGAYLLGLWGLNHGVIECVAFHHCPGQCPASEILYPLIIVHAANILDIHAQAPLPELMKHIDPACTAQAVCREKLDTWTELSRTIHVKE